MKFTCKQCGTGFKSSHQRKFCSRNCAANDKRDPVERTCIICRQQFTVSRCHKNATHCSWFCLKKDWTNRSGISSKKYRVVWDGKKQVYEHRMVMERILGRRLTRHEAVHHINGNGRDNRPQNLQLVNQKDHSLIHSRARFDVGRAIDMFKQGLPFYQIAKRLGCHRWSVQYSLECRGYKS